MIMFFDTRDILNVNAPSGNGDIDIRAEINKRIINSPISHSEYIIYRRFDTTILTEYWDEEKKEAVNGYKHPYTDNLYKVRINWSPRTIDTEENRATGIEPFRQPLMHCEYDVAPTYFDKIFRMRTQPSSSSYILSANDFLVEFDIIQIVPYTNLNGRIEFYTCILKERERDDI